MRAGGAEISNISAPHAQTNERLTQHTHDSAHDMTMSLKEVNSQQLGQKCYPPQVSILKSSIREETEATGQA